MTRVLLADDEPHLARRLRRLLEDCWDADTLGPLELLTDAADGDAALAQILGETPDLVFLDIRMPGISGIDVVRRLLEGTEPAPVVVFVTAYSDYAVAAFEAAAADYLLKPVSAERLRACLHRLSDRLGAATPASDSLRTIVDELRRALSERTREAGTEPSGPQRPLRWLRVGLGERTELLPVEDIVYFKSEQKYTSAVTATREYLLRTPLKELQAQLDPDAFWQIHRGTIVNVADIVRAERDLRGRYLLSLRRRPETLRASQTFAHLFRQM